MTDHEEIVIAASVLVDPLIGAGRTLQLLDELEHVVGSYLPGRVVIALDFTDATDSGDISFWWYHRVLYPGFCLVVDHRRECAPAVRQTWVLDHDDARKRGVVGAERVRGILMEPGDDGAWVQLMDEVREYAALIAG